jgi:hypothetical protein
MPQYLLSVWHDNDYDLDFSTPNAQRQGVYDRRRQDLDGHAAYVVVAFVAGG